MKRNEIIKRLNLKVEKFEDFRKSNKLSKAEFCKRCGVSLSTYNKILSKEYDFYLNTLFKILRVSGLHICDVV